jgi:hypothetical protein
MKLQAVLIAVALAAGGSAFAAATSAPASNPDATVKPTAAAPHQTKSSKQHKTAQHTKTSHKSSQHAKSSSQHAGASGHRVNTAMAAPQTNLQSPDRQSRIDHAYADWRAKHG